MVHLSGARLARAGLLVLMVLLLPVSMAWPGGIAGEVDYNGEVSEVTMAGCLCHAEASSDDVTILLDGVPYAYTPGETYSLTLQIVGGPERGAGGTSQSAGFSMRTTLGQLIPADGNTQNWEGDATRLTHTSAGSAYSNSDRLWSFDWTAPATDEGLTRFYIAGNSVNGDGNPTGDQWNRLNFPIHPESETSREGTRMVFVGTGDVSPPETEHETDLHEMGAKLRAHWLGLLGFAAVLITLLFCGLMLRYGFSASYKGRSNLLRLRIKTLKRGDQ
ncbi:MAG: hypothetical protein CMB77_07480 [Euryarchaeota archaeon]|nr:hypothetical protein [Euryarchaeota archaeon]